MKRTLPHNSTETDIDVTALPCRRLNNQEEQCFRKFAKEFNQGFLPIIILCTVITLFFLFVGIYNYTLGLLSLKELPGFSLLCIFPFVGLCLFCKSLIPTKKIPVRVHTGYLKGVWYTSKGTNKKNVTRYLDVIFPNGTRYRKVITSLKNYKNAKENCHVLVISFDDKTVYGCILDKI